MVTSYVPSDPCLPDRSVLRGPRPVSDLAELYYDWAKYRLASLAGQVATQPFATYGTLILLPQPAQQMCMSTRAWSCVSVDPVLLLM